MFFVFLITIIVLFVFFKIIGGVNRTNKFLQKLPLNLYIEPILEIVNAGVFDSEAIVRNLSYKHLYLWRKHDSILINFDLNAEVLFVDIHYKLFGNDNKLQLKYKDALRLNLERQKFIALEIVYLARQIRLKQLNTAAAVLDMFI